MKIIVLDGGTLNPGDLSWDALGAFGEYEVYDNSIAQEIVVRGKDADILLVNKVVISKEIIDNLPKLKYIGATATGYNNVDTQGAKERGIIVTNVPTYGTYSVSQLVFALLLELCHHVGDHSKTVHEGKWANCPNFCYWDFPLLELAGLTMGIVGYGRIGHQTAKIAEAFGMNVITHDVFVDPKKADKVKFLSLDELFAQSDVISLHCPLTKENEKIINTENLELMKPTAFLINTSRGQLVNEQDLADALNSGRIAGAGLDVLSVEPPKSDNPLLTAKNCYITPHLAWATRSARQRLIDVSVDNISAFIAGKAQNVVS